MRCRADGRQPGFGRQEIRSGETSLQALPDRRRKSWSKGGNRSVRPPGMDRDSMGIRLHQVKSMTWKQ